MSVFLHNARYRCYFLTSLVSQLGSVLFGIVFVIYARHLPDPKLAIGISSFIATLPMLAYILTGYLADQTRNHFRQQLVNRVIQGSLYLIIAGLMTRQPTWPIFSALLFLSVIASLLTSYDSFTGIPIIKDIVSAADLVTAQGFANGMSETLAVSGGLLGAALLVLLRYHYAVFALLNAASFFVAFGILFAWRRQFANLPSSHFVIAQPHRGRGIFRHFSQTLVTNWQTLRQHQTVLRYIWMFALVNLVEAGSEPLFNLSYLHFPQLLFGNYGYTVALIGMCSSVGTIIGSLLPPHTTQWLSDIACLLTFYGLLILQLLDILTLHNRLILAGIMLLVGLVMGIVNPRFSGQMVKELPEKAIGSLMSTFFTIVQATIPLGSALFVLVANLQTVVRALNVLLVFAGISLLVTILSLRRSLPQTAR